MNKSFILIVFYLLVSWNFLHAQEITKMKQVMHAHDVAMEKMPTLVRLVSQLQPKVDSTKMGQIHQVAVEELKASNKAMMLWMQNFGERFTADEMMKDRPLSEKKQEWLTEEQQKIKAVRKKIERSIAKANKLLQ